MAKFLASLHRILPRRLNVYATTLQMSFILGAMIFTLTGCETSQSDSSGRGLSGTVVTQSATPPSGSSPLAADTLVFNSDRSGNHEVYTIRTDGSDMRQLTNDATYDSWWARTAPNRQRILFYRTPKGSHDLDYAKTSLWIMNADGTQPYELRPQGTDGWELQGHAEWSPDGAKLVMFGGSGINPQIYITDALGKAPRKVTDRGGQNLDPSWSPDGSKLVFVGCPAAVCFETNYEIYTITTDGSVTNRLTDNNLRDHDPYYSPDGSRIAWIAEVKPGAYGPVGVWDIFTMAANGSGQKRVINDDQINSKPHWSRDGSWLFFHRFVVGANTRSSVYRVRPDGTSLTEVTRNMNANAEYPSN